MSEDFDAPSLSTRFEEALVLATRLPGLQRRKGTDVPYVAHLLGVASLVLEGGGDEDQAIAALLHDAVEDQGGPRTLEEIRRRFGDRVAGIVEGCTATATRCGSASPRIGRASFGTTARWSRLSGRRTPAIWPTNWTASSPRWSVARAPDRRTPRPTGGTAASARSPGHLGLRPGPRRTLPTSGGARARAPVSRVHPRRTCLSSVRGSRGPGSLS